MAKCLLAIDARDTNSTKELEALVQWIDANFDLLSISSIYELQSIDYAPAAARAINAVRERNLSVAISLETDLPATDLVDKLSAKQLTVNKELAHSSVHLYLLFYDNLVSMLPNLYLPHPEWLVRKDWMLASMDLWPNFEHPVLEESIAILGRNKKIRPGDYFFAQGKPLLKTNLPAT